MYETVEQLQQIEAECLRRFRKKASQLKLQHVEWSDSVCFAKAVSLLPRTAEKYQFTRHRLLMSGVGPLPLR
jgi:hypothetical protein